MPILTNTQLAFWLCEQEIRALRFEARDTGCSRPLAKRGNEMPLQSSEEVSKIILGEEPKPAERRWVWTRRWKLKLPPSGLLRLAR
jgi:hypothetical protein